MLLTASMVGPPATGSDVIIQRRASVIRRATSAAAETSASDGGSESQASQSRLCNFTRLLRDPKRARLQTSITTYTRVDADGSLLTVDLVSAVHIADRAYYKDLQRRLAGYDRVLYELVADKSKTPEGERWRPPHRRRRSSGPVGAIQTSMASSLSLSFQLSQMDYRRENWWHADLEWAEFKEAQKQSGETLPRLLQRVFAQSYKLLMGKAGGEGSGWRRAARAAQALLPMPLLAQLLLHASLSGASPAPLHASPVAHAFISLKFQSGLKLLLAEALTNEALGGALLDEETQRSVIIGGRNAAAAEALRAAISAGSRRVAIFYGSAHLPDMERILLAGDFGLQRSGEVEWLDAWNIPLPRPLDEAGRLKALSKEQAAGLLGLSVVLAFDLALWETFGSILAERLG